MDGAHLSAAIVTIGSELVEGLRIDTNTAEIAREVSRRGFSVTEAVSVADDEAVLAQVLRRLVSECALVVVTGGLGPTHDDVTREAAAAALGREMRSDPALVAALADVVARHTHPDSAEQVLTQALVIEGATVLLPTTGTAPGQVIDTPAGSLVLLPGPPREMRPMLQTALATYACLRAEPRELGVTGMPESDVQHAAQRALGTFTGVALTVLAKPGDVRVLLLDGGAGDTGLAQAAAAVAAELGDACYAADGSTLAEAVVREAIAGGVTLAAAESCTGGLIAAALTDVPGASAAFLGGVVAYGNSAKTALLGVDAALIADVGAVSAEVACAMASGARERFGCDLAVSVTGIAGPDGGTPEKPVGLVWFGVSTAADTRAVERKFPSTSSREAIRARSTATALDLSRREMLSR